LAAGVDADPGALAAGGVLAGAGVVLEGAGAVLAGAGAVLEGAEAAGVDCGVCEEGCEGVCCDADWAASAMGNARTRAAKAAVLRIEVADLMEPPPRRRTHPNGASASLQFVRR